MTKGWFPKGWFWRMFSRNENPERMFPRNENRNEGTFGCSPGTQTGTRVRSPKPPFYETALLSPSENPGPAKPQIRNVQIHNLAVPDSKVDNRKCLGHWPVDPCFSRRVSQGHPAGVMKILLKLIGSEKTRKEKTRKQNYHEIVPGFWVEFCLCVFIPHKE